MSSCTLSLTTTLEEYSIHVEEYGQPNELLYAVEGESPKKVARQLWKRHLRDHPECPARMLRLRMQAALPPKRLDQVVAAAVWLLSKIIETE